MKEQVKYSLYRRKINESQKESYHSFKVNGTTHVLVQNKLPDLISGSLVYCFRIPAGRSSDHGSSFSK